MQQVILLIEDEPAVLELAAFILEREGFRTLPAASAVDALEIFAREKQVDLVLSDIQMEGMSGIEFARRVLSERPETRVLLMSGYPGFNSLAREHGFAFLPKPFTADVLVERVRAELWQRQSTTPKGHSNPKVRRQCG